MQAGVAGPADSRTVDRGLTSVRGTSFCLPLRFVKLKHDPNPETMKKLLFVLLVGCGLAFVSTGCSGSPKLDAGDVATYFDKAAPDLKAEATKIVEAVKAGKPADALAAAQKLANSGKLSPEQDAAIQDIVGQLEKFIGKTGGAATKAAEGAVKDATNALPKK